MIERELPQERLVNVLRQVPAFVAVLRGPELVFEMANPAYLKLIRHREAVGRPLRDVLDEGERQGFIDLLDRVYRTGKAAVGTEVPIEIQPEPGGPLEERYLNFVYQPNVTSDGRISGIIVHGVDVTELVEARRTAESQAEELQSQAIQLEEAQSELEGTNQRLSAASREADETRARLEAVIEQMPSGIVIADASDGRVIMANRQVEQIWRQPPPKVGDASWERFRAFHPDGTPYREGDWPLDRALAGAPTMNEEMEILRADRSRGVISVNSGPIRDRSGRVVAAVAVFDDVTERWQHEREQAFLAEAARIFSSSLDYQETLASVARLSVPRLADWCAVDVLEEGVVQRLTVVHRDPEKEKLAREGATRWPTDPDGPTGVGRVLRSGEAELYQEITEAYLREAVPDQEHRELLLELGITSAMIVPLVVRGRTFGAITFVSAKPGRRFGPVDLRAAEKLASRAAIAVDHSLLFRQAERSREEAEMAQRRAEEARRLAEAANRAKSEFLANMSHEMRTPLNAVTGYTELLEMEIAGPLTPDQRGQLSRIGKSTDHLLALINDLLDLARIESGRLEVHRDSERAAESVEAALGLVRPQAAQRDIELLSECGVDGTDAGYVGDRDRVRQILVNLIGNAIKFTRPGGRITITCGSESPEAAPVLATEIGPWTYIRVEDTGVGIEPEQIERIFRPFEQVQGGYTRESGGAGLGLSISRQLALLMGGELKAESVPGRGSTFTLWLPARESPELAELGVLSAGGGQGFSDVGNALLGEIETILERYVERMRADPRIGRAKGLAEGELKDHHSSLLSDFAAALLALDDPGESQVRLLRDGSEIQRLLAELHGRQRAKLGWSEGALQREFEIWGEVLQEAVSDIPDLDEHPAVQRAAIKVIHQLIARAQRVSLRAFRAAIAGTPGVPEESPPR